MSDEKDPKSTTPDDSSESIDLPASPVLERDVEADPAERATPKVTLAKTAAKTAARAAASPALAADAVEHTQEGTPQLAHDDEEDEIFASTDEVVSVWEEISEMIDENPSQPFDPRYDDGEEQGADGDEDVPAEQDEPNGELEEDEDDDGLDYILSPIAGPGEATLEGEPLGDEPSTPPAQESEPEEVEPEEVEQEVAEPGVVEPGVAAQEPAQEREVSTRAPYSVPFDTSALPLDEAYVADLLIELGELAEECGMKSLAEEIEKERLPALARGRVTLVTLGEFNHGKSTVVNALLGADVLPVGITPTTAVITHLVYDETPTVTIQPPHGGEPYTIAYEGMEKAVKDSGEEGEEPEFVEIGYPNDVLAHSLVLVDTPGVNDISRQKVEITYGYLPRADVILYVLDATQVLKKSEVTFIRDRLLRANRDRIIFVLNKIDALSPEDIAEVEQYARERLETLIGPVELFAFSGRKALDAQRAGEPLPESFVAFHDYLMGFLQEQRAYIILDSALAGGSRVSGLLAQNLAIKRQGYQLERAELDRRIVAVRSKLKESRRLIAENTALIDERISGIAATARHNLRIFTEQFLEQLPSQIERAEARDIKRHLPDWIRDTFKAWLEEEGQNIARSLEELAEEIIQITNESLKDAVESYREEFGLSGELDMNVDTVAYDVSVFALGAFGVGIFFFANMLVGSLLTLATPLLAFFLKEKVDTQIKTRARDEGVKAIEVASEKLEEEILRVIHDYGARLKDFVETAGDRLYRQIEEALEQVQQETRGNNVDRATLLATADRRLERVRGVGHVIRTSRERLAAWATEAGFQQVISPKEHTP